MSIRFFLLFLIACLSPSLMAAKTKTAPENNVSQRAEVRIWADAFGAREGIDTGFLLDTLKNAKIESRIIELMDAPIKAPTPWFEYAPRFLNEGRISGGVSFWKDNETALTRAQAYFGLPPEIVVAIIGVETHYGRNVGSFRVLDALVTLAFNYPRRADYFRGELEEFFLLALDNGFALTSPKGSYAGAMGIAQFMPRSYRYYAVDFNGDGRVDLWQASDAIGSVAFYLKEHGWQTDAPVLTLAQLSQETEATLIPLLDNGLSNPQPWKQWRALGVNLANTHTVIDDNASVSLLSLDADTGPVYFLAHDNFRAILRYNKSRLYAAAIAHLAEAIKTRGLRTQQPVAATP
ncbi:MAG: lytic murein transglycosylase B [Burkholderiales bacterium]|jgi:membrane-bound lytic murein transglycosylase B|nr:lytic murein transglycosylase B [Burkholderiales bacterium]